MKKKKRQCREKIARLVNSSYNDQIGYDLISLCECVFVLNVRAVFSFNYIAHTQIFIYFIRIFFRKSRHEPKIDAASANE